jgi:hypothetical protein
MADDLEASITEAARTLAELRVELGKLLHAKGMQNTEPRQRADSTLSE